MFQIKRYDKPVDNMTHEEILSEVLFHLDVWFSEKLPGRNTAIDAQTVCFLGFEDDWFIIVLGDSYADVVAALKDHYKDGLYPYTADYFAALRLFDVSEGFLFGYDVFELSLGGDNGVYSMKVSYVEYMPDGNIHGRHVYCEDEDPAIVVCKAYITLMRKLRL